MLMKPSPASSTGLLPTRTSATSLVIWVLTSKPIVRKLRGHLFPFVERGESTGEERQQLAGPDTLATRLQLRRARMRSVRRVPVLVPRRYVLQITHALDQRLHSFGFRLRAVPHLGDVRLFLLDRLRQPL